MVLFLIHHTKKSNHLILQLVLVIIPGWDEGIGLLQVGDKARLVIPSDLGCTSRGAGGVIPPDATLVFDVELMDVK